MSHGDDGGGTRRELLKKGLATAASMAARFRIFEYALAGGVLTPVQEITLNTPGVTAINWQARLANKKTSFHRFEGPAEFRHGTSAHPLLETCPLNASGQPVIDYLGRLRTDSAGRLIVIGGKGRAGYQSAPPTDRSRRPTPCKATGKSPSTPRAGRGCCALRRTSRPASAGW